MKKILFGITSLTLGGAERVLVDLSNKLCEEYEINILTIYAGGELEKQLDNKVNVISLYEKPYDKYSKFEHVKISLDLMFKKKVKGNFDVIVAFLEGPITRLFSKRTRNKITKIAWIHNDISKVFGQGLKAKIKKYIDKRMYRKYDKIIFVSEENKRDFDELYNLSNSENKFTQNDVKENIIDKENNIIKDVTKLLDNSEELPREIVIRNYLDYNRVIEKADEDVDLPYEKENVNLVSVCRLVQQKGIDRFIKVASKLKRDGVSFKVFIVGDGPIKLDLQKQIEAEDLQDTFYLLGAKENPYPYIKNSDYFCLLSYYEGYGMVLDEAKILNKPIIITNTAAVESIQGYENAVIAENTEDGIYNKLKSIILKDNKNNKIK